MGAWIEILVKLERTRTEQSLLSWERGLKFNSFGTTFDWTNVAPLVGAWIEIVVRQRLSYKLGVAPLVGAWIEITSTTGIDLSKGVAPLVGAWIEI